MIKLSFDRHNTCLLAPDTDPMIDERTETTKIQLSESMSLTGITYSNVGEGLLTGSEMTQR